MKAAIVEFSLPVLAEILQLPRGAEITGIELSLDQPDIVCIRIAGAGWDYEDGGYVIRTVAMIDHATPDTINPNEVLKITYPLPTI